MFIIQVLALFAWLIAFAVIALDIEDGPFWCLGYVWDETKGKLNIAGRIICMILTIAICGPGIIVACGGYALVYIFIAIGKAFYFIFKDRSQK